MHFTIGKKLLTSFSAILILVVVIGLYILSNNQKALEQAVGQGSVFLVEDIIQRIDKGIFLKLEEMERFSSDPLLQKELKLSNEAFKALPDVDAYIEEQDAEWVATPQDELTPFMESLITNPLAERVEAVFILYSERKYGYKTFGETIVTNKFGANVAMTNKTEDYFQADETWWEGANEDVFSIGGFEYDESSATWGIPLSLRVADGEGNFLGVIKSIVPVGVIAREIEIASKKYDTTELLLLTDDDRVIYETGAFKFLEDISHKDFFDHIHEGETGFFVEVDAGRERLFSYAHSEGFHNYAGLGWSLVISHDTQEVFASVWVLRNILIGVFSILLLVIILLAYVLSRSISLPVKRLTQTAEKIALGDFDVKASITSKDEIGVLGGAFNVMTEKLKKQIVELKELDRLKDDFLNNTTHELKTPLIPIKSQTQLLLSDSYGELNQEQKESIEMILKNETRLESLITDIMDISKSNSKKMTFVFEKANLANIITESVKNVSPVAEQRNIQLILNPIPELPALSLDEKRITQVVGNLLNNALKFTPKGGSVTVGVAKGKNAVTTKITDTGIGMSANTLKKLFTPFFQADSDAARKYPGTGLGLSISKTLIEAHGGTVKVVSKGEGKGSTFVLTLPL